ncbi:MAG: DNA polymerase Y family protein, partial [Dehalococcoidia bacterium]
MSITCLTVPRLGLSLALSEHPALAGEAVALSDEAHLRVVEITPAARRRGVRPGMPLREAVALCPTLAVLEPRGAVIARCAASLVEAMEAVSPLVEEAVPGVVFADLRGTDHLYPRLDDLARAVFSLVPAALGPRLGVAEHRRTAYIAAHRAEPGTALRVGAGEAAAFLADQPVSWLGLEAEAVERLRLLGIATCGALAALPRHAVEAQFGPAGGHAWLAARGEDPAPVRPRPWARERVVEQVQAEPPLISREAIQHALEQMLGRALRQPRAARRFVRWVRLRAESERGAL